ncbi:alpha amylase C-terminal domain-containing protein, partial [Kineococcus rubinsiae]
SGAAYEDFRVGLPTGGTWRELLNTDAEEFAGSGVVNTGPLTAEAVAWNGQEQSVQLRVPPLGVTWLVPDA